MQNNNKTIIKSYAFNMYCTDNEFDNIKDKNIISTIIDGDRQPFENMYDKVICFNPSEITEINYDAGSHNCNPVGNIIYDTESTLLLHYKYIGKDYLISRYKQIGDRLSKINLSKGFGSQYLLDANKTINYYYDNFSNNNIFRKLYPDKNIGLIKFNNNKCIIDTFGETDIISDIILKNNIWEPNVSSYIKQNVKNCTFIDIGCNIGFHSCIALLSDVNYVYAFECNPKTFNKFKNTIFLNGFNNINLKNIGISDSKKTYIFNEVEGNIGASHIVDTHIGWNGNVNRIEDITTDLLDNLIDTNDIYTENIVIKIDVEGHEFNALNGMKNILNDIRTNKIIIELNPSTTIYNTLINIIDYLIKLKFIEIKLLFDISKDNWYGEEIDIFNPISITYDELKLKLLSNSIVEVVFIR